MPMIVVLCPTSPYFLQSFSNYSVMLYDLVPSLLHAEADFYIFFLPTHFVVFFSGDNKNLPGG